MMLQQEKPQDFVIATGRQASVRDFVEMSAASIGWAKNYDCKDIFSLDPVPFPLPVDYDTAVKTLGLSENFFVPKMNPEACSPYEPDINIKPLKFLSAPINFISLTIFSDVKF